ncbi:MAG: response regulator [Candidatus Omnitrophica bacterium]|nr:response regulator [Candidatus Omnitrophota bacterium]
MEPQKVLLVDDEQGMIDCLKEGLELQGYQVLTAQDGNNALELARKEIPHLILLDLMLPGLDGYHVLKLLKSDERYRGIPILVITARGDAGDLTQAVECGADGCLVKPLQLDVLMDQVHNLLGNGRGDARSV